MRLFLLLTLVLNLHIIAFAQTATENVEAYANNGNRDLAIRNYKRSLELNPKNTNAVQQLKKLGAP